MHLEISVLLAYALLRKERLCGKKPLKDLGVVYDARREAVVCQRTGFLFLHLACWLFEGVEVR